MSPQGGLGNGSGFTSSVLDPIFTHFFSYLTQILCSELNRSTSRNVADQNKEECVCVCKRGPQHEGCTGVVASLPGGWSLT